MKNKIAEIRKSLRLSQEELAKRIQISRPHLSVIENGNVSVSGAVMLKISSVLGQPVEDIFFADNVSYSEQCNKKKGGTP